MKLRFFNWEKYNPPSSKTNSWFRLNSNLPGRMVWDALNHNEFRVFIYLLCQANESDERGNIHLSTDATTVRCTVSKKEVLRTIQKLKELRILEERSPSGRWIRSEQSCPTNETNERNETNETNILSDSGVPEPRLNLDFESLYVKYPRKEGKRRGLVICRAQIKTQEDFELLSRAIEKYRDHVRANGKEAQFIKIFSTFMGEWRDWLEEDVGSVEVFKKKSALDLWFEEEKIKEQKNDAR